jgi:two-component system, cell cycle sensor histidine kinase and response regulator CckA
MDSATRYHSSFEAPGLAAAALAHDLNNILGVILGCCALLKDQASLSGEAMKLISDIQSAGMSGRNISEDVLASIRQQASPAAPLDLNQLLHRMRTILDRIIGDTVHLVTVPCPQPAVIQASASQVEQLLMNLVVNAREATPQGGKITIQIAEVTCADREDGTCRAGSSVMVSVADTGTGMDAETQAHMFEPCFSTKKKGTGLGLSIVSDIVKQAGGAITVASQPDQGTTFRIYFPCAQETLHDMEKTKEPIPHDDRKAIGAPVVTGNETILLVEDSDPLRRLTRRLLEDCGYMVLESGHPVEALRIARDHPGSLPLMITDLSMPGFSGRALAQKLALLHPETRVLFTSGYPLGVRGQEEAFLQKPFTRDDLLQKVRELLDSPPRFGPGSERPAIPASKSPASRYSARLLCG